MRCGGRGKLHAVESFIRWRRCPLNRPTLLCTPGLTLKYLLLTLAKPVLQWLHTTHSPPAPNVRLFQGQRGSRRTSSNPLSSSTNRRGHYCSLHQSPADAEGCEVEQNWQEGYLLHTSTQLYSRTTLQNYNHSSAGQLSRWLQAEVH